MKLSPIAEREDAAQILWDLLAERMSEQSISHKKMPTWEEHLAFVELKKPKPVLTSTDANVDLAPYFLSGNEYQDWCLIQNSAGIVGAIYLTRQNEIGVSIFGEFQGHGCGKEAIRLLMQKHGPRRYLANINPENVHSQRVFESLGFEHVQNTLALEIVDQQAKVN
jgi:RimJ/RimL family protein N-acetyltransferase